MGPPARLLELALLQVPRLAAATLAPNSANAGHSGMVSHLAGLERTDFSHGIVMLAGELVFSYPSKFFYLCLSVCFYLPLFLLLFYMRYPSSSSTASIVLPVHVADLCFPRTRAFSSPFFFSTATESCRAITCRRRARTRRGLLRGSLGVFWRSPRCT